MRSRFFGSTMLAILGWQTASAVEVSWYRQVGSAVSITGNASGSVWIAGTDRADTSGYNVYKWNGKEFATDSVAASRKLAATSNGQVWLVNDLDQLSGPFQVGQPSVYLRQAHDVAVGGDDSVWIIGTDERAGGYGVYQRSGINNWTYANLAAVQIAVDKTGNVWVVNDTGQVSMYNIATKAWERVPVGSAAKSIYTGASGAIWLLVAKSIPGGFPVLQWDSNKHTWEPYGTYAAVAIAEAAGVPWIVQSDGKVYSKAQQTTSPAPVDVTQTWPTPTPQQIPPLRATQAGKLLCSSTGTSTTCTDTKADYVGAYKLNTKCDAGFYDPIYGGSCWKCPSGTDGRGAFIRSLTPVTSDTACWRAPLEATGSAILAKAPAWAWECPAGSFWDGYSPNGAGGSCWRCPADLPRRTAAAVWASNACATAINETARAVFLTYNGCPKPDAATMDLPGNRTPGKPFLDIAAGATQSSSNGVCFACPVTDEDGNFLITDRNASPLYNKDTNTGCTTLLKWKPAPFYEPGLAYMPGVKGMIWEQRLFDGARITGYLYDTALGLGLGDGDASPAAKAWVTARWQEIVSNPYNSDHLRAFMFVLLKQALKKDVADRTLAEKNLLRSFATYIQQRRTYLAQQALAAYDAWKANDDLYRANTGQSRSLSALFYYGTVPLDFHGTLSNLMGVSAAGGGTLGALVAANKFAQGVELTKYGTATRETSLFGMTDSLRILKTAQGLSAVSGAAVIQVAFAILSSVAIDQFVAIETARPTLQAALVQAQKTVDLDQLAASDNGEDMIYLYWSRAMEATDTEDPQVLQLAAMAQVRAEQSGYAAPPANYYLVSKTPTNQIFSGNTNGYLEQDQKLVSRNGTYEAEMQADGNFVIYAPNRKPIWATGTNGKGVAPYQLALQADGSLAVYGSSTSLWSSGVKSQAKPFMLVMQDDGNLVEFDGQNQIIWQSGTSR